MQITSTRNPVSFSQRQADRQARWEAQEDRLDRLAFAAEESDSGSSSLSPAHEIWPLVKAGSIVVLGGAVGQMAGRYAGEQSGLMPGVVGTVLGAGGGALAGMLAAGETAKGDAPFSRDLKFMGGGAVVGAVAGAALGGLTTSPWAGVGLAVSGGVMGAVGGVVGAFAEGVRPLYDSKAPDMPADGGLLDRLSSVKGGWKLSAGSLGGSLVGNVLGQTAGTATGILPGLAGALVGAPLGTVATMAVLDVSGQMKKLDMDTQNKIILGGTAVGTVAGALAGAFASVPELGAGLRIGGAVLGSVGGALATMAVMSRD